MGLLRQTGIAMALAAATAGGCASPSPMIDRVPGWLDLATESAQTIWDEEDRINALMRIAIEWMEEGYLSRANAVISDLPKQRRVEASQYLACAHAQVGDYDEAMAISDATPDPAARDGLRAVIVAALVKDIEFEMAGRLAGAIRAPAIRSCAWSRIAMGQALAGELTNAKESAQRVGVASDKDRVGKVIAAVETVAQGAKMCTPVLFIEPDDWIPDYSLPRPHEAGQYDKTLSLLPSMKTPLSRAFLYARLAKCYARAGRMRDYRDLRKKAEEAAKTIAAAPADKRAGWQGPKALTTEFRKAGGILLNADAQLEAGDRLAAMKYLKWTADMDADPVGLLGLRSRPLTCPDYSGSPDSRRFCEARAINALLGTSDWSPRQVERALAALRGSPCEATWLLLRLVEHAKFQAGPPAGEIPIRFHPRRFRHPQRVEVHVDTVPPGGKVFYVVGYEQLDNWTGIKADESTQEGRFMVGRYVGRSPVDFVVIDRGYSYFDIKVIDRNGQVVSQRFGRVPKKVQLDVR